MVPVVDLGGQPLFYGCQRLGDQLLLAAADLTKVLRNKVNGGILQRLAFEIPANPVGKCERREGLFFLLGERPVVEERGVAAAADLALARDLDELKPLRDGPPVACPIGPSILVRGVSQMGPVSKLALEPVAVEQGHEELEVPLLAVVRRGGQEQEMPGQASQELPEPVALRIFDLASEVSRTHLVRL